MINENSISAINRPDFSSGFFKPMYETYSFSRIPDTIFSLFGCKSSGGLPKDCIQEGSYERIIFILIDGFGWKFLMQYGDKYPFLKRFFDQGIVSKISSQFPSTTAAHITTLCSNKNVGEHGIYEWFMYEPSVNRVIAPLLYTFAQDRQAKTIESLLSPNQFFPASVLFQNLKNHHIKSTIFQHQSIVNSIYSNWMSLGAQRVGYRDWSEGVALLTESLKTPGFFYVYYGGFDSAAHRHGLESVEVLQALDHGFYELEAQLMRAPQIERQSTALIVTADHGMINIDPLTTIDLKTLLPSMTRRLKRGADGNVLAPVGSCRAFFLHLKELSYISEVQSELEHLLKDKASVYPTSHLCTNGFFGPNGFSDQCQARMGDLVILPTQSHSVWWYEKSHFEHQLYATHGGLSPDELETTFLFYRGSK